MIRYTPGFAPQDDKAPAAVPPKTVSVDQAKALAAQRQTQVLDYTRKKAAESPLKQNLRTDGPTLEEWLKAGYEPKDYPPVGYAEKDSPALADYKAMRAAAGLSTAQVASVSTAQVASLTTAQVSSLATTQAHALAPHAINERREG